MTEIVDLDAVLQTQFPQGRVESMPLYTERVHEVGLVIIRVTHDGRTRHQLYAITEAQWALTAIYGNYTDAMRELLRWRSYISNGGTLAVWQLDHQDGIYPERSGFSWPA
jgi:hypothetical protein